MATYRYHQATVQIQKKKKKICVKKTIKIIPEQVIIISHNSTVRALSWHQVPGLHWLRTQRQ